MEVYRVENRKGKGPYMAGGVTDYMGYAHRPSPRDPGEPWYEGPTEGLHFGFKAVAACLQWFNNNSERHHMAEFGHRLSVYVVADEHVKQGRCQLVFDKDHAELIKIIDLTTI